MTAQSISSDVVNELKGIVGAAGWLDASTDRARYLEEWRGLFRGETPLVLRPESTEQVAGILECCNRHQIGVVPQGGNTGLAGGAIPGMDGRAEVLLSLERMQRIRSLDAANFTLTAEAGCVLQRLQSVAAEEGCFFPLSLAAEGSCQIGGNVSTNAGGTAVLRYGNTRDLVLGLEVVLPDGRIVDELSGVRKDNTGYDLKQLFIGAEGTLGIITAVTVKLFPAPVSRSAALLGLGSVAAVLDLFALARRRLGDEITAFEMFPDIAMQMVTQHFAASRNPFAQASPWYVLIDVSSQRGQPALDAQLLECLAAAIDDGCVVDGVVAQSETQREAFWGLRHGISEAQKSAGGSIKHDVSVPVSVIPAFIDEASKRAAELIPGIRPVPFGHIGDGNIHYNLSQPKGMDTQAFLDRWSEVNEVIHSLAADMGGSFSAEHGIGYLKRDELARLKDPVALQLMRTVKQAIDPNGIMNPGKLLG